MRKLIVSEFVTLDGVFEDPGGSEGTKHGGWNFQFWNDQAEKYKFDELFASDALLLGRVTYQGFAKAWPVFDIVTEAHAHCVWWQKALCVVE